MNRLNALAKEAKINENASIRDQHSIIINAPIEKVWETLLDLHSWPKWNPEVSKITVDGPIKEGTKFNWTYGQNKFSSEIQLLDQPHALSWTSRSNWVKGIAVWQLEKDDNQTIATAGTSFQGAFTVLVNNHQKVYKELLGWLDQLKKTCESGLI